MKVWESDTNSIIINIFANTAESYVTQVNKHFCTWWGWCFEETSNSSFSEGNSFNKWIPFINIFIENNIAYKRRETIIFTCIQERDIKHLTACDVHVVALKLRSLLPGKCLNDMEVFCYYMWEEKRRRKGYVSSFIVLKQHRLSLVLADKVEVISTVLWIWIDLLSLIWFLIMANRHHWWNDDQPISMVAEMTSRYPRYEDDQHIYLMQEMKKR